MRNILICFIFLLCASVMHGQTIDLQTFQSKTHMVSPDEKNHLEESGKGFTPTAPPGGLVRSIAEFEPTEGVIVGYSGQFGIPFTLVAQMSQVANVYTIVANITVENNIRAQYTANGVNLSRCYFVHGPLDSYWARDYGPWFIADSSNRVAIVDFPYNRPRANDDNVPVLMATALGVPLFGMNVKHTGGNYMSDGTGRGASTKLVITENTNLTLSQINTYHQNFLGLNPYYTLDDPLGDYIEHIDCWGKFLAPDKILLGQVPSSDTRYQDYEAIAAFFAAEPSAYGTPYKVYRVYSPNGQPYTNSYILNNKVFVPVVTTYGTPWNDSAIAVYQRAMPGYDIQGIYALSGKPWESTDALHCRVHEIADRGMLSIRHNPLSGNVGQKAFYEIMAEIIPFTDSLLYADSVFISYRYDAGPWHQVLMMQDTGWVWKGNIPDSAFNVTVSYAIHAADHSGRSENHPYIGIPDPHHFRVVSTIGIQEAQKNPNEILVFPNPCDDRIYAAILHPDTRNVQVNLLSVAGILIQSYTFSDARQLYDEGIPVFDLQNGIYFLELITGERRFVERVMVLHP